MDGKNKEIEEIYKEYLYIKKRNYENKPYNKEEEKYWKEVTVKASIEAMKTIIGNVDLYRELNDAESILNVSVNLGIKLTEKLKKALE